MIYELAHVIKDKVSFLWNFIEWVNAVAFYLKYRKGLKRLDETANDGIPEPYEIRVVRKCDIPDLLIFFNRQPKSAFKFFNPHSFEERSIRTIVSRKSFLTFILTKHGATGNEILGYAFMRCFINGSSYRGYMVDTEHRGRGLAQLLGLGMNKVGDALDLKMYKSISPENPASMKVTQKVCNTEVLKTLENGDYLIKCTSKPIDIITKNL